MQQKTNIIKIAAVLGILLLGFLVLANKLYSFVTTTQSPTISQTRPDNKLPFQNPQPTANSNTSEQNTTTANTRISSPTKAAPTINTVNSPKQSEIRQSTTKEYTYYPLVTANDPAYSTNWAIQQTNSPSAWNISTGSIATTIAVIDTGFALNHEDLVDRWATNNAETGMTVIADRCWTGVSTNKQTNNCDDDNNGYVDDWRGWNFALGDNDVMAGRVNPSGVAVSHGTETAGLAGSSGNNGLGTTTISWNTKIMPLQAMSDDGPGYTSDVTAAIYYAVDNGADVINMSLGGYYYDEALAMAIDYAYSRQVVVVAAAGNCGIEGDSNCSDVATGAMLYPALNDHVVSVGATTEGSERASFSSYGPDLDITAPGAGSIISPTWRDYNGTSLYVNGMYGTSFASPQVASLVALIKSIRPSSSVDDIVALLSATATKPNTMNGALYTDELGHGIINAGVALTVAQSLNSASATPEILQTGSFASEHSLKTADTMSSGCKTSALSYCTVKFSDSTLGRDRYLPYKLTDSTGKTGWTWPGTFLTSGNWQTRATVGDSVSTTPYYLLKK